MNAKHPKPAPSARLSPGLLAVLRQWDDTDADTLAASKERIAALGSGTSEQLTAFLRHRNRICSVSGVIGALCFALVTIVLGLSPHSDARAPYPMSINVTLASLFSVCAICGCIGGWANCDFKYRKGLKALVEINPSEAISVLADKPLLFLDSSNRSVEGKCLLLMALQNLLNSDRMPPVLLSETQRRNMRRFIRGINYTGVTVAVIQFFTRLEDGSAVPQARRVAKLSRVWEIREAANEYLAHFAPEEADRQELALPIAQAEADTILSCVMRLGSRSEGERQRAQTILHNMDAAQLEQVLQMLGHAPDGSRRVSRIISACCICVGAAIGSLTYLPCIHSPYYDTRMALSVAVVCALGGGAFGWLGGGEVNYRRCNRQRARMLGCVGGVFPAKRLLETLVALDNPALLNTLIVGLPSESSIDTDQTHLRHSLQKTIARLQTRLGASDTALLDEQARTLLNAQLGRNRRTLSETWVDAKSAEENAAYDVAILKAWEQVGDERALPYVEKLAAQSAASAAQKRVQQAARECLPYLQARADHQRVAQTLLRAAHSPAEPGDVLLRAASASSAPVETEQLLRAAQE